ncbi:MAG: hypothetical protein PHQ18_00725 [Patescibacteria group bacterium]|nr:hypothetical protein [Patescibacteria group bacterium]
MADNKQQTILIKKADGTKVRVSLEEFKKMRDNGGTGNEERGKGNGESGMKDEGKVMTNSKAQISNQVQVSNSKPVSDEVEIPKVVEEKAKPVILIKEEQKQIVQDDLMVETPHELATFTPVHDIFVDEAAANFEWKNSDSESLLAVDAPEVEKLKKKGVPHVEGHDLQEHIKMPHADVTDDLKNRAKSLVISWQKGIRNDNQLLDYATRNIDHGGLGLDSEQASRFLQNVKNSKNNLDNLFEIVFEKKKKTLDVSEIKAEAKIEKPVVNSMSRLDELMRTEKPIEFLSEKDFSKPFSHTTPSTVVHDVASPSSFSAKTMGPKQEMESFSLVEYRRLAKDPKKCADMLMSKLNSWKSESFLLFLEVLEGWQNSPLNKMYVDTTVEAINNKKSVAEVLQAKNKNDFITLEEYQSLVDMDNRLI